VHTSGLMFGCSSGSSFPVPNWPSVCALNKSVDDDGDDDGNGIEQFSAPGN
jgi:hypothetical protein